MSDSETSAATIRVKFVAKGNRPEHAPVWQRQLPGDGTRWHNCVFDFDPEVRDYDWLVVYDDLPTQGDERFSSRIETLACAPKQTLFITAEPSSIKTYGRDFLDQFGTVISSQEPWATPGANVLHHQPALRWYYGVPWDWYSQPERLRRFDDIAAVFPGNKQARVSTVTSNKRMGNTEHRARFDFVQQMAQTLAEMDSFGRGVRPIDDKAMALDGYRYHLAIENHYCPHHFTEKLADAFLGGTLPFYYGCPNYTEYFPEDALITVDIHDFDGAAETIRQAIANDEFSRRLPAIREARRRVLYEHNIFAMLSRLINERHDPGARRVPGSRIYSRHRMRRRTPLHLLRYLIDTRRNKGRQRKFPAST